MRTKVTNDGVTIPKDWFPGVDEVEIQRENGRIIVAPVRDEDPISQLGVAPIECDVDDAAMDHDRYLYGS